MRRDDLEKRREDLSQGVASLHQEIEQLRGMLQQREVDLIATQGALQEVEFWIRHDDSKKEAHLRGALHDDDGEEELETE